MKVDYHIHSDFSHDSRESVKNIIEHSIENNFDEIVFTDHLDIDFPENKIKELIDVDNYIKTLGEYQNLYRDKISIKIGLELGLQVHLEGDKELKALLNDDKFDFLIGSIHAVHYKDLNTKAYFGSFNTKDEAHRAYFEEMYRSVQMFKGVSVIGHMDFIKRYGRISFDDFNILDYELHDDIITKILKFLIENNIGIELNTSGYRYKLDGPNAGEYILKKYKSLGGEIITIGSDSHKKEHLGEGFDKGLELLKKCGFNKISRFSKKKVSYINI